MFPAIPPARLEDRFGPLVKAIDGMLSEKVVFRTKKTPEDYELALLRGDYDIAVVQQFVYVKNELNIPYKPLLRRVETGKGVIVVAQDSELTDLTELKNRTIAIPSSQTIAVFLARHMFKQVGLTQDQYSFVDFNNHDSCLQAVVVDEVIACASAEKIAKSIARSRGFDFKILAESEEIPGMLILTHSRIDHLRDELIDKILDFSKTSQGKEVLRRALLDELVEVGQDDYREVKIIMNELRE